MESLLAAARYELGRTRTRQQRDFTGRLVRRRQSSPWDGTDVVGSESTIPWASNPSIVAFHERKANGERDIWVVGADGEPTPFVLTPFDERTPRFSPDGKRLAYVSNESGRDEVYVQPFPGPGEKWLVSTDGGLDPVWSRNGRELFYRQDDQIMVVSIATDTQFSASRPQPLFEARFDAEADGPNFDVSPDGQWFVMLRSEQRAASAELNLVLNWFSEITARTPAVK